MSQQRDVFNPALACVIESHGSVRVNTGHRNPNTPP